MPELAPVTTATGRSCWVTGLFVVTRPSCPVRVTWVSDHGGSPGKILPPRPVEIRGCVRSGTGHARHGMGEHVLDEVTGGSGVRLAVRTRGPAGAPPVVLLHGRSQSSRVWTHQFTGALADSYRLVAV